MNTEHTNQSSQAKPASHSPIDLQSIPERQRGFTAENIRDIAHECMRIGDNEQADVVFAIADALRDGNLTIHPAAAAVGKLRMLLAACNRIEEEAEEFEGPNGLEMGITMDHWHEFAEALTAARKALAAAQKDPRQAFAEYHLGKPFSIPTAATLRDIAVNSRHGLSVMFCDGDFQVSCTANVWLGDRAVSGWFKELPDAINSLWAYMEKARQEAAAQKGGEA